MRGRGETFEPVRRRIPSGLRPTRACCKAGTRTSVVAKSTHRTLRSIIVREISAGGGKGSGTPRGAVNAALVSSGTSTPF